MKHQIVLSLPSHTFLLPFHSVNTTVFVTINVRFLGGRVQSQAQQDYWLFIKNLITNTVNSPKFKILLNFIVLTVHWKYFVRFIELIYKPADPNSLIKSRCNFFETISPEKLIRKKKQINAVKVWKQAWQRTWKPTHEYSLCCHGDAEKKKFANGRQRCGALVQWS